MRNLITGDRVHDAACGIKAFRRALLLGLPRFNGMHRYSGYDELFDTTGCVEVGCWAHARRYGAKIDQAMRPLSSSWDAVTPAQQRYIEVARRALEAALPELNRVFAEDVARFREAVMASGLVLFPEREELGLKG